MFVTTTKCTIKMFLYIANTQGCVFRATLCLEGSNIIIIMIIITTTTTIIIISFKPCKKYIYMYILLKYLSSTYSAFLNSFS